MVLLAFLAAAADDDAVAVVDDANANTAAPAPKTTPEAQLAAAQAALEALKLEEAQASLEDLVADPAASDAVRARAWLTLGLTRASLLDDDGARVAFAAALAIDDTVAPPRDASPKVQRLFEKTRARLPAMDRVAGTGASGPRVGGGAGGAGAASHDPLDAPAASAGAGGHDPTAGAASTAATPASSLALPLTIGGGLALAVAAGAGVGALVADNALATPVKGRTRDEYDGIRAMGLAAVIGAGVFGVAGAALLAMGGAQ